MQAPVGETVRLFVGNGGPNLVSSFHVIGEIFDRAWQYGGLDVARHENAQSVLIPAGGSAMVESRGTTGPTSTARAPEAARARSLTAPTG